MTENFPHSAAQNIPLLEAIGDGGADSPSGLAARAGIAANNLSRKLAVLAEDGLIASTGDASHAVALTEVGRQALAANAVFRGERPPGDGGAGDGGAGSGVGAGAEPVTLAFDRIDPWPGNPRTHYDEVRTQELAVSIGDKGVLQAITVRRKPAPDGDPGADRFEVLIGERRRRACGIAVARGWRPADFAIPCEIRDWSDDEAEEVAGIENVQREDLHWMDEARWYLKLANRLSAAAIERLVGGTRGKRSIQDYIKCARELSPDDIARTYLPDDHANQLSYVRARELTGEKKERPALDLSPKLALAFLETLHAGLTPPVAGETVVTCLHKAVAGGPLATLSADRGLVVLGLQWGRPTASILITDDVDRWLTRIGYADDPDAALRKVRAAVIGDIEAAALARDGDYLTLELRKPPARTAEPERAAAPSPPPAPAPPAPAPLAPEPLPPMLEIVIVEVAHKLGVDGRKGPAGGWGCVVAADWYKDGRCNQLIQGRKLLAMTPAGDRTLAIQTEAARALLVEDYGLEEIDGRVTLGDALLEQAQLVLLGARPAGGLYSTPFLNLPVAPAPASAMDAAPAEVPAAAVAPNGSGGRDQFSSDLLRVTAEARAFASLAGAARQARAFVEQIGGRTKAPRREEVGPIVALLDAALDAVAPYLTGRD